jgi:predicted dehydrogenase
MLKVGLIGVGFMGRGHVASYKRLEEEGAPVRLDAVCDVDPGRIEGRDTVTGNIGVGNGVDLSSYARYSDYCEMLRNENLDYVDIALPTFLHAQAAIASMEAGCHVLCEKPMARTTEQCEAMIATSRRTTRTLMTAHCLRFWPAYEYLKEYVDKRTFGDIVSAYFFRGGGTPKWSWQNWLLNKDLSGGCLLDQHVHDVDMVQWLFGMPQAVSANAVNVIAGSGYDAVSTRYFYGDGKVVCAEDDWTINGAFGFDMIYRANFKHGSIHFSKGKVTVYPETGEGFEPKLSPDDGYYREILYFIDCLRQSRQPEKCLPESTRNTIALAQAEQSSAEKGGAVNSVG